MLVPRQYPGDTTAPIPQPRYCETKPLPTVASRPYLAKHVDSFSNRSRSSFESRTPAPYNHPSRGDRPRAREEQSARPPTDHPDSARIFVTNRGVLVHTSTNNNREASSPSASEPTVRFPYPRSLQRSILRNCDRDRTRRRSTLQPRRANGATITAHPRPSRYTSTRSVLTLSPFKPGVPRKVGVEAEAKDRNKGGSNSSTYEVKGGIYTRRGLAG
ncbi:hypothetical protein B0T13DRAFT_443501 [Neurospora crassa]|nr:hypothetical protein B0T13DRAFT_443501 [Neurospora crassa]